MYLYSLFPCIMKPTRITSKTASPIDNIFCNDIVDNQDVFTGIWYTDISDHFPMFILTKQPITKILLSTKKKRIYSQESLRLFSDFKTKTGLMYYRVTTPRMPSKCFPIVIGMLIITVLPLRTIKCGYKTRKPWLSEGLKRSIQTKKNKLYHRKQKSKRLEHDTIYKKYRNNLNKLLLMAEKKHYEQRLEENKCNSKGSWCVLKNNIHKKKSVSSCSRFLINNKITSDKQAVANGFNLFFIITGVNLAKSIINVIRNLKASSPGWGSISAVVVKATYQCFIEPLTHNLNLSVMYGVFPSELKLAKVIPFIQSEWSYVILQLPTSFCFASVL